MLLDPLASAAALRGALPLLGVVDVAAWLAAYTRALTRPAQQPPNRTNRRTLFQSVTERVFPPRVAGGAAWPHDLYGPTHLYVDYQCGWRWRTPGGDWIGADGGAQGANPWASVLTAPAPPAGHQKTYTMDVTAVLNKCVAEGRWFAFLLRCPTASRTLAGAGHASAPRLRTSAGGVAAVAAPLVVAVNSASSDAPSTQLATVGTPCFLEFACPPAPVDIAELDVTVLEHWSGPAPVLGLYLLDPPLNTDPVRPGVAAGAGLLDDTVTAVPGVIGAHRYLDGVPWSSFSHPAPVNVNSEAEYSPSLWGGAVDTAKLPFLSLGKWINVSDQWALVTSGYTGEGFAPLAPGIGALRIHMPAASPAVVDGSVVTSSGTLAANGMIFLPDEVYGRLKRLFVRYYFRLGDTGSRKKADRKHVRHDPGGAPVWTTGAGKFGITPHHTSGYGGVSGSSGGPYGWQMRHSWYECDAEVGGPDEAGIIVGHHLYDYLFQNPPGHNYGGQGASAERWGQRGGYGSVLYTNHWYCIETELDLNTISDAAPGYTPDGALRTWVNGRLVWERTGMVFRTGPVHAPPAQLYKSRPCRELGHKGLWLNFFHGGKTYATVPRVHFYTGLVYGTEYIGPMNIGD